MEIEIDYNPTPNKFFFVSVEINKKEAISFDCTRKGHRIIKQILVGKRPWGKTKADAEWETLVLKDGRLVRKYHVKWKDLGREDQINGEIWKTVWEQTISVELTKRILRYSQLISDNFKNPDKVSEKIKEFENLLKGVIKKIQRKDACT